PELKIVSKRDYQLDGVKAISFTCFYDKPGGTSQRLDWFLIKPYMLSVAYVSPKPSSWDDPVSKQFFASVHLQPKNYVSISTPIAAELIAQGIAAGESDRLDEAVAKFTAALATNPSPIEAAATFYWRANAYVHQGLFEQAWTDLRETITRDPK